jgi:hypothetical protein
MMTVVITFRKCNKNSLERLSRAYRSRRKRNALYLLNCNTSWRYVLIPADIFFECVTGNVRKIIKPAFAAVYLFRLDSTEPGSIRLM